MDYKLAKEALCTKEVLYSGVQDQAVEIDLILPDYNPEIFKVLSLDLSSRAIKESTSGSKFNYEIEIVAKILYYSEDSQICSASATALYSKAIELPYSAKNPHARIGTSTVSQSFRVTSKRRVSIRGTVKAEVEVTQELQLQAVSSGEGCGIELLKESVTYPGKSIEVTKRIVIADEIDLPSAKPSIGQILQAQAKSTTHDKKALSGKLLVKGEADIELLYIPQGSETPESLGLSIPFSQILDIEALDDRYEIYTEAITRNCEASISSRQDTSRGISISAEVEIKCKAMKFESKEFAVDAFSTHNEVGIQPLQVAIEGIPTPLNETFRKKATLTYSDGEISEVISISGTVKESKHIASLQADGLSIKGKMQVCIFAKDESGKVIYLEGITDFDEHTSVDRIQGKKINARSEVSSIQYNLLSSNAIEVICEVKTRGYTYKEEIKDLIAELSLSEDSHEEKSDYGLKLYYAQAGESIWEIAKRCRTSRKGITEENGIDQDRVTEARVLLIPYFD